MEKYILGEIFSSGGTTLFKNPSDQTVPKNWMIFSCLSLATATASLKNSMEAFRSFKVLIATSIVFWLDSSKTVPLKTVPNAPLPI